MVVDTFWRRLSLLVLLLWLASLLALGGGAATGIAPRQTFPFAPMPPRPGLLEELQQAGQPLPYLLHEAAALRQRGLNQGPQRVDAAGWLVPSPIASPQGSFRALALLVQFTDKPAQVGASYFDTLVFDTGTGTVRDYYRQVSYGTLDIVTVNLPSSTGWFAAPQTYAYYCHEQNGLGVGAYPQNAQKLVEDVVALADPLLDFSPYDNDGDGYVDALFVVHAGTGAEHTGSDNDIWSHQWVTTYRVPVDGKYVFTYAMAPEYWDAAGDMTCGVFAHELGHVLGLPDLYDCGYDSEGVGRWSLMGTGCWNGTLGDSPAHLDAWCRARLGFVTPVVAAQDRPGLSLPAVEVTATGSVYRLWNQGTLTSEYFLLENRQPLGYDAALPGHGLLIWHIDEARPDNETPCTDLQVCNCLTHHYQVALVQADGLLDLEHKVNRGDAGDPYPGSTGNRSLTLLSTPNSGSYADCTSQVAVTSISDAALLMTTDVVVGVPPTPTPTPTPSSTPTPSPTPTVTPTPTPTPTPVYRLTINGGAAYTNKTTVTLTFTYPAGANKVRLANTSFLPTDPQPAWQPIAQAKSWTLGAGDGLKTVYAQFSGPGNTVSPVVSASITLDSKAPAGRVTINDGVKYTKEVTVTLSLAATDASSGVTDMLLSDSSTFAGAVWLPYTTTSTYVLADTETYAPRYVYARFRDRAENVSRTYYASVILDHTAPTGSLVINDGAASTASLTVTLSIAATDTGSGIYLVQFSNDGLLYSDWLTYTTTYHPWVLAPGDNQTKTVYARFQDRAGNVSAPVSDTIFYMGLPPVLSPPPVALDLMGLGMPPQALRKILTSPPGSRRKTGLIQSYVKLRAARGFS